MKNITRREFFKRAAIAAASGYVGMKTLPSDAQMRGGGMGGGGGAGLRYSSLCWTMTA